MNIKVITATVIFASIKYGWQHQIEVENHIMKSDLKPRTEAGKFGPTVTLTVAERNVI